MLLHYIYFVVSFLKCVVFFVLTSLVGVYVYAYFWVVPGDRLAIAMDSVNLRRKKKKIKH